MKQHHLQLHPVRQASYNMALVFLPVYEQSQDEFLTLERELEKGKEFEYLSIEDFCPSDPRKKYRFIPKFTVKRTCL